jgi:hypothetical protein
VLDFPTRNIMGFGYLNEIIILAKPVSEIDKPFRFKKTGQAKKSTRNDPLNTEYYIFEGSI